MKEELISFETAKLAKEKGFDWNTDNHYCYEPNGNYSLFMDDLKNSEHSNNESSAPTKSLLQKWLRDEYNIDVCCYKNKDATYSSSFGFKESTSNQLTDCYKTYEEALEEGLFEALKLINP